MCVLFEPNKGLCFWSILGSIFLIFYVILCFHLCYYYEYLEISAKKLILCDVSSLYLDWKSKDSKLHEYVSAVWLVRYVLISNFVLLVYKTPYWYIYCLRLKQTEFYVDLLLHIYFLSIQELDTPCCLLANWSFLFIFI